MNLIGDPFIILPTIDSTNIYATSQLHARMASHGAAWFALEQTAGKGQRGKTWKASVGENIILSVLVNPPSPAPSDIFQLSCLAALACYDLFKNFAPDLSAIKWPNDLYLGDRKAGGILIENIIQGNVWKHAIIGMGLNINQSIFEPELPNPTSLKITTGQHYDAEQLARKLCDHLQKRYEAILDGRFGDMLNEYNECLYRKDKVTKFKKNENFFAAIVKRVTPAGKLVLLTDAEKEFDFGEIEWMIS
jgi:BirA family biotin operon repressor/biotin-[acetyl-CoA-carboxylase] ligase